MTLINDKTKFSLSIIMSVIALSFSVGLAWAKISQIESLEDIIRSVDQRLSRIEGKLGVR